MANIPGITYSNLMDMEPSEVKEVWLPQAIEQDKHQLNRMAAAIAKAFNGEGS